MSPRRRLTDEELLARGRALAFSQNCRLAASTSFSEREVAVLGEIFEKLLRGVDMRRMRGAPELGALVRKVQNMKTTVERQRARRAVLSVEAQSKKVQ